MSKLEEVSVQARNANISRNEFTPNNQYNAAIATADGIDVNRTDNQARATEIARNTYNQNNQYDPGTPNDY